MATKYNFRGSCDEPVNECYAPPPDFSCVDTCNPCHNPCEPKCPPKVRAKDALCLTDDEWERCFSLYQYVGCSPVQVPAFIYCIEMRIRKQGLCRVLTKECPTRADVKGNACFIWSDDFRKLPAGYYEGDVYINGKNCFTLLFRKRGCWTNMKTESVELDDLPCEAPERCCGGCVPQPDFDNTPVVGDCEECNGSECK